MKKIVPLVIVLAMLGYVAGTLLSPHNPGAFDLVAFGKLPVLADGRIKPLDTVARSSLLQLQGRQEIRAPEVKEPLVASPVEWLADVFFRPEKADTYPVFAIDHLEQPDVDALIGRTPETLRIEYHSTAYRILAITDMVPKTQRRFSYKELEPHLEAIQEQAKLASQVDQAVRTPFQKSVFQLYQNLIIYHRLRHTVTMPGHPDFLGELQTFQDKLATGVAAVRAKQAGQTADETAVTAMTTMGEAFMSMSDIANILAIPPAGDDPTAWQSAGKALLGTFQSGTVDPYALAYAGLAQSWRQNLPDRFNKLLGLFQVSLDKHIPKEVGKAAAESRFNAIEPFYTAIVLYACVFFLGVFSWVLWPEQLWRVAFFVLVLAWVVATAGLIARMWLGGRPPVTNLYSSALFIGWGVGTLCLILEWIYKNAIATVAAGAIGFVTYIIAHHLALEGDTLEMMRAVLDTNIWLATHVVIVTTGYAATFLAGALALIYVLRGILTPSLDKATADALGRMVYGIVCFATLFSFTGTVLGGIWADQSWGRFWGWDPKENGALIIVLWNSLILHARWGGMIRQRGLMCLAIFGNVVTAWSWFGTNMLGVGLHSYGFTDAAFWALAAFILSQLAIIALANLPLEKWWSFRVRPQAMPDMAEVK